ncbi:MAG: hypothetical protein GYB65_24245 [Chloroflexi bacterium]|nr:hypothetical protein [Chloroflexota bacterium]
MGGTTRLLATIAIWTAFALMAVALFIVVTDPAARALSETLVFGIVLVLAAAATISTFAVWRERLRKLKWTRPSRAIEHRKRLERLAEAEAKDLALHEADTVIATRRDHTQH